MPIRFESLPTAAPTLFDAVLFDFDGTLVDTMPLHYEAYRRVFADLGLDLGQGDFFHNVGGKASETIPRFLGGRSPGISVQEIHARKKEVVRELLQNGTLVVLGAGLLLPLLRGRYRLAVASSGSREGIELILKRLGWRDVFDAVITGEDVRLGKPAPDLFLEASQRLAIEPQRCFVFEDTDDGLEAARRAGMTALDVRLMESVARRSPDLAR